LADEEDFGRLFLSSEAAVVGRTIVSAVSFGSGVFNTKVSSVKFVSVKGFDGFVGFIVSAEFNMSESSALAVVVGESDFRGEDVEFLQSISE